MMPWLAAILISPSWPRFWRLSMAVPRARMPILSWGTSLTVMPTNLNRPCKVRAINHLWVVLCLLNWRARLKLFETSTLLHLWLWSHLTWGLATWSLHFLVYLSKNPFLIKLPYRSRRWFIFYSIFEEYSFRIWSLSSFSLPVASVVMMIVVIPWWIVAPPRSVSWEISLVAAPQTIDFRRRRATTLFLTALVIWKCSTAILMSIWMRLLIVRSRVRKHDFIFNERARGLKLLWIKVSFATELLRDIGMVALVFSAWLSALRNH